MIGSRGEQRGSRRASAGRGKGRARRNEARAAPPGAAGWGLLGNLSSLVTIGVAGAAAVILYPFGIAAMERELERGYLVDYATSSRAVSLMPTGYVVSLGFRVLRANALYTPLTIALLVAFVICAQLVAEIPNLMWPSSIRTLARWWQEVPFFPGRPLQRPSGNSPAIGAIPALGNRLLDNTFSPFTRNVRYLVLMIFIVSLALGDSVLDRPARVVMFFVALGAFALLEMGIAQMVAALSGRAHGQASTATGKLAMGLFLAYLTQLIHSYYQIPAHELTPPRIVLRYAATGRTLEGLYIAHAEGAWYLLVGSGNVLVSIPNQAISTTCTTWAVPPTTAAGPAKVVPTGSPTPDPAARTCATLPQR